jgi:hypothetical protein
MLRLAAAREGLDDHHASAAAGARTRQHTRLIRLAGGVGLGHRHAQRHGEQLACARDVCRAIAGEQAVMADAMEALRKVAEEASNERRRSGRYVQFFPVPISYCSSLTFSIQSTTLPFSAS